MSTEEVGALVMEELKRLDKVAYVRFASVYRHFRDIGEFMTELKDLLERQGVTGATAVVGSRRGRGHGTNPHARFPRRQQPVAPAPQRSSAPRPRRRSATTPGCCCVGIGVLVAALGEPAGAGQPLGHARARLPDRGRALRALRDQPHDSRRARLRARAQHRQAGRREAPGAAVCAFPRQAGRRAARDDADSGGAGADRRQRADPQQRRSLVQRADGRCPVVGERHCRRLLPGAAAPRVGARRSGWRARSASVDCRATPAARSREIVEPDVLQERIGLVEVYRVGAGRRRRTHG